MEWFHAVVLGLIQGLTEFLPVSSSGHLAIFKAIFGIESDNLSFEVAVHAATVLSTIVAFRREIWDIICGVFKFRYNSQTQYFLKICVSMIPVAVVGFFFKDQVEAVFGSGLIIVGCMLLLTAFLLFISETLSNRQVRKAAVQGREPGKEVGYREAFIIGLSQALAVMPGLSRSGTTISTGLMLGVRKSSMAQFSFLMVLVHGSVLVPDGPCPDSGRSLPAVGGRRLFVRGLRDIGVGPGPRLTYGLRIGIHGLPVDDTYSKKGQTALLFHILLCSSRLLLYIRIDAAECLIIILYLMFIWERLSVTRMLLNGVLSPCLTQ